MKQQTGIWALAAGLMLAACGGGGGGGGDAPLPATPTPLPGSLSITAPATTQSSNPTVFGQSIAAPSGLSFNWDFGDGSAASTEAAPTHVFAQPGDYQVRLTVSDASGASRSASFDIAVNNQSQVRGLRCSGADDAGWCQSGTVPGIGEGLDVIFLSPDVGWGAGSYGGIYKTVDGGRTWVSKLILQNEQMRRVVFADADHGWALTYSGKVYASADGGRTWQQQLDVSAASSTLWLHVEGASRVLLAGGSDIGFKPRVSVDGGQTWRELHQDIHAVSDGGVLWGEQGRSADFGLSFTPYGPIPLSQDVSLSREELQKVRAVNGLVAMREIYATMGVAESSRRAGIAMTRDGGLTWTRQDMDPRGPYESFTYPLDRPSRGRVTTTYPSSATSIWALGVTRVGRSLDGGATWSWLPGAEWPRHPTATWGLEAVESDPAHPDTFRLFWPDGESMLETVDGGTVWKRYQPVGFGNINAVYSFKRLSAQSVVLHTTQGYLRSDDDGANWYKLGMPVRFFPPIDDLAFWDDRRGLALRGAQLLTTEDGGRTWTFAGVESPSGLPGSNTGRALQLLGDTVRLLSGERSLMVSPDRGLNWVDQTTRLGGGRPVAMNFFDAMRGIVAMEDKRVLATTDGGVTWTAIGTLASSSIGSRMSFSNSMRGLIHKDSTLEITGDGGATWTTAALPTNVTWRSVKLTDGLNGWAVGAVNILNSGVVYETRDGGLTWTERTPPTSTSAFNAIHFQTPRLGWIVGNGGLILRTRDAGATWSRQDSGANSNDLTAVHFNTSKTGWLGGSQGEIMATGTGGD